MRTGARPPGNAYMRDINPCGHCADFLSLLTWYTGGGSKGERQSIRSACFEPWLSFRISHATFSGIPVRTRRSTPTKKGCKVFIIGKSERSEWSGRTKRLLTLNTSDDSRTTRRSLRCAFRRPSGTFMRATPPTTAGKFCDNLIKATSGVADAWILAVACKPMSLISHAFKATSVSRSASSCSLKAQILDRRSGLRFSNTWKRRPSISSGPSSSLTSFACCGSPSVLSPSPSSAASASSSFFSSACVLYSLLLMANSKP
mmetsp:Transcript_96492/g.272808  ORF Transcript_96492/g.272808 Transcript_96492/m.272808 type:complete len:259 (+) Transcript_96492:314-1090(+)